MKTIHAAGKAWRFSHTMGRRTAEHNNGVLGGFAWPMALAIAPDGNIFVLSRGWQRVNQAYGMDIFKRIGKTSIDENHFGDFARAEFTWPAGIAVSNDGKVYVSDECDNYIKIFEPDKIFPFPLFDEGKESIAKWGEKGSKPGQLGGPSGLIFDRNDDLLVVDSLNNRIQKFTKDGRFISAFGSAGSGDGQFNRPWGITVDRKGDIYVADWGNNRVQKFTPAGKYVMSFGVITDGGELNHPADVAVDSDGDVYVTDWGNDVVKIYEPNGSIIARLEGDGDQLSKAAALYM